MWFYPRPDEGDRTEEQVSVAFASSGMECECGVV